MCLHMGIMMLLFIKSLKTFVRRHLIYCGRIFFCQCQLIFSRLSFDLTESTYGSGTLSPNPDMLAENGLAVDYSRAPLHHSQGQLSQTSDIYPGEKGENNPRSFGNVIFINVFLRLLRSSFKLTGLQVLYAQERIVISETWRQCADFVLCQAISSPASGIQGRVLFLTVSLLLLV